MLLDSLNFLRSLRLSALVSGGSAAKRRKNASTANESEPHAWPKVTFCFFGVMYVLYFKRNCEP